MEFFGQTPVSSDQAALIARGLYALSRIDGHEEREGMLIQSLWMDAMGWDSAVPLRELESAPDITGADLARGLVAPDVRLLFLKTALLRAYADSAVSPKEKAWIDAVAKAFGTDPKEVTRLDELVRTFLLSQLSGIANTDATKEVAKKLGF